MGWTGAILRLEDPDDQARLADQAGSREWGDAFIRTYLERDLPQLGINLSAITLRRFWTMLAHYHGQTWNGCELARALGVSDKIVSRYLDILEGIFMAFRLLLPWHTNLGKREVKSPKVYVADTGVLHRLLGIGGLVTGATGFVGRRLCERMAADGWQVLGAVRLPRGIWWMPL